MKRLLPEDLLLGSLATGFMDSTGGHGSKEIRARQAQFQRFYAPIQERLYALVFVLVPRSSDADDVMQETMITLWRKFDQFQPGTDFAAWAAAVARLEAKSFHRRRLAGSARFAETLLDSLADRATLIAEEVPERVDVLRSCLKKLSEEDRKLIQLRYEPNATIKRVAEQVDRPIQGLYKAMARIHGALVRCVRRSLP